MSTGKINTALLISGSGSTAEAIIKAYQKKALGNIVPVIVISSSPSASGVMKAKLLGIPTEIINRADFSSELDFGNTLLQVLNKYQIKLVSQNGWLPKTPKNVVTAYSGKIINQHIAPLDPQPGALDFGGKGMYGIRLIAARMLYVWITRSYPWTESTVHLVTEEYDKGAILKAEKIAISLLPHIIIQTEFEKNLNLQHELVIRSHEFLKQALPIEHQTVISALRDFSEGNITFFKREYPLVPSHHYEIALWAKNWSKKLFPKEHKREDGIKQILIIGSGGREHAIGWKLKQDHPEIPLYFAPGNGGTAQIGINLPYSSDEVEKLTAWAKEKNISLTIVGPEAALSAGVVDSFQKEGLPIFGPTAAAARLETSKAWSARFLYRHRIPQPPFRIFSEISAANDYLINFNWNEQKPVIKVDGLAAGKGVFLPKNREEAQKILEEIMVKKIFGKAGNTIVIQKCVQGEELSVMAFCDGNTVVPLVPARDYKRQNEGDTGPNTGGMGAIAPAEISKELLEEITAEILQPVVFGMRQESIPFVGVLYAGLIITAHGPYVLEFNVRFGDPETQVQLPLLKSDLLKIFEACLLGNLSRDLVVFKTDHAVCVVLTSAGYPEKYATAEKISGLSEKLPDNTSLFHAGTTLISGEATTSGGRVLGIVGLGGTLSQARDRAYSFITNGPVRFPNQFFRRDIGLAKSLAHVWRIEVRSTVLDMRAQVRKHLLEKLFPQIDSIEIFDVYTCTGDLTTVQIQQIAEILANPVTHTYSISTLTDKNMVQSAPFSWAFETGFLPGVTDNIGNTVKEMAADLLKLTDIENLHVYTSQVTLISGIIDLPVTSQILLKLHNPLIQRAHVKSYDQYISETGMDFVVPEVKLTENTDVSEINLHISDSELEQLGKRGITNADGTRRGPLALDLVYLKTIRQYFDKHGRTPTDIELESLAQTWSEHCKHTIFADPIDDKPDGLFNSYIKKATEEIRLQKGADDFCVSVFTDNSGAIVFDDNYIVTDKVETHNSPSALDPFGGSITGIVGVNRDAIGFGLGAKPIINRYGFCFAPPDDHTQLYRDAQKIQPLLTSGQIIEGIIAGVNSGGNCSGIPTTQGFMYFEKRYRGKPLVFVGTVGLQPRSKSTNLIEKKARPGDFIVMAGGRVGLDGIHGATFSSEALTSGSPATAVQIGDPITQKKLSDVLVKEARDQGLYHSITDNGAGGLSCSVAEMARESGGCEVDLEKVILKYPGLSPWQIWISESQERMTLAVPAEKWPVLQELLISRGVEACVIGTFTDSGHCVVKNHGKVVMDIAMEFLHHGLPKRQLHTNYPATAQSEPQIPDQKDLTDTFLALINRLNIGSIESVSMQYDHEVQGGSVIKPLVGKGRINTDATVVRPVLDSAKGVVLSHGLYPSYSDIDTYAMAAASIDTAVRNAVVAGAKLSKIALLDNFCWCSSTDPERLGQLKRAVEACYDISVVYGTPFISGKDSMFNDFKGYDAQGNPVKISIPPTLLISAISIIDDVVETVTPDFKIPGDYIYILGETYDELGASEYYSWWNETAGSKDLGMHVPKVNPQINTRIYTMYYQCVKRGLISSAQSLHRGGLAAALAKSGIAGQYGADISLSKLPGSVGRSDGVLFSESQGRILVAIAPQNQTEFEEMIKDIPFGLLGRVREDAQIHIFDQKNKQIVDTSVKAATRVYKANFGIVNTIKPQAIVLAGYGLNCEEETAFAFERAGVGAKIVHINDVISSAVLLSEYEILVVPGGFAYGDDTGSGNAFAQKMKNHLWEKILKYVEDDHLIIGICNGFQVLVNLGLLPGLNRQYGHREVALLHNTNATYTARWVDLKVNGTVSPWFKNISELSVPIAHGEGKFYASDEILSKLKERHLIAANYFSGQMCRYQKLPANPNGSVDDIAGITDESGRILGLMPHPERAIAFTQLPNWHLIKEEYRRRNQKLPDEGPGLVLFRNAFAYFEGL